MIKLNLLPEKVRAAERLQLIIILGVALYLVGLLFLGWRWMAASSRVSEAQAQIDQVQKELDAPELREAVEAVDRFTKDQKEMTDKSSVVNALRKRQVTILRMLDALPDWMLNSQVWVQQLTVDVDRGARKVTLEGRAASPLIFAHFFTNLESQPIVKKLKLDRAPAPTTDLGRTVTSFLVSFEMEEFQ